MAIPLSVGVTLFFHWPNLLETELVKAMNSALSKMVLLMLLLSTVSLL
jgi:hypothetical protein